MKKIIKLNLILNYLLNENPYVEFKNDTEKNHRFYSIY